MSLTLNEISYNLLNSLRGGRSSNNDYLSLEQIKFTVNYYRALFIRRDMQRNANRYRMFEQDLGLLDLTEVNKSESSISVCDTYVLRTNKKIPTPIRMKNWEGITFVGGINKSGKPIPIVDAHKSYWNQFNKYINDEPESYYRDGHIYIENTKDIDDVNIRGVFENPEEVFDFVKDSPLDLYEGNKDYPISSDMLEGITKGLLKGELKFATQTQNDISTDTLQDKG